MQEMKHSQLPDIYIYIFIDYESYVDVSCLLLQLTVKKPGLSGGSDI